MSKAVERTSECQTNTQFKVMLSGYDWFLQHIEGNKDIDILDVACGMGYGSDYLAAHVRTVTGIDVSRDAIGHCLKQYVRSNLTFKVMDGTHLEFADNSFDAVVSQDTIEHVTDDHAFLSELRRVVKPGGLVVIFTPYSKLHNPSPASPFHIREYSTETFRKLLAKYFHGIKIYGRVLSEQLRETEQDLDRVRVLDVLGIRSLLPRRIRHWIGSLIARSRGHLSLAEVSLQHVRYTENINDRVITQVAVCRK